MNQQTQLFGQLSSKEVYLGLELPDSRLVDRLDRVVRTIENSPDQSFPNIFSRKAERDGFYRLVNNDRVGFSPLIKSVSDGTLKSIDERPEQTLLAIHDTTTFTFNAASPIEGLGQVTNTKQGFFGHFCLGVAQNREILGILGLVPRIRDPKRRKKKKTTKELLEDPDHERRRWLKLILEVHERSKNSRRLIHVADREADDYTTLSGLVEAQVRFVFRARYNRTIPKNEQQLNKLFDSIGLASIISEREVVVSPRGKKKMPGRGKGHPERKSRIAKLGVSAKKIAVCRSGNASKSSTPTELSLNFVRVFELDVPEGVDPIEWLLVTSEPIESEKDLLQVVDIYCTRWVIEEYFKALKTGCAFEKRGLESYHAILNTLAILAPIAVKLYNLKILGRNEPNHLSSRVITPIQIKILAHITNQEAEYLNTLGEAILAIAAIGGHIKNNGPPGWQVLGRGYQKLLQLEKGWIIAQQFNLNATSTVLPRDM